MNSDNFQEAGHNFSTHSEIPRNVYRLKMWATRHGPGVEKFV
jgi:hypothetical protein